MALPTAEENRPRWRFPLSWRRVIEVAEGYPLERIGLAALAAGVLLRLAAPFLMDFRSDGDTYTAMGHAWMMRHEFLMPYGDVTTWGPLPPGYSNHYPPAYPFYLGVVFSIFGFGLWQAKWAAVVVAVAALVVVYYTTRDLYGKTAAALAAGLMGLEPHLLWVTGAGFSENMVLLFFALTLWAIVRPLKDDRYIVDRTRVV
jgi:4-amino-4-deoxy-L-arabinose transferase-like glycosyltransferase